MLIGAHCVLNSTNPDADLAFFRDVLKLPSVSDGGYVIFGLPPSEMSVHKADSSAQALFLMCKDVNAFVAAMKKTGIACGPVADQGWGVLTELTLPGGGKLSVYQPRHKRPAAKSAGPEAAAKKSNKKK